MIDLHMHTIFSDGCLCPAELIQRCAQMGHRAMAMTDHVDHSNLDFVLPRLLTAARELSEYHEMAILAGVELTHCPPDSIAEMTRRARGMGAQLVVVHGQSLVEPVAAGTNLAAIMAEVDILAHPGLLTPEEAELAARNDVCLEISARKGHSLGNGRTAALAREAGARLVIDTDSHDPGDLIDRAFARQVGLGAGLSPEEVEACFANSLRIVDRALGLEA